MKVLVYACALTSIMFVGCATVKQDVKVSNANVDLEPVMFEPITEVIDNKVVGQATDSSTFWGLISTESPSEFVDSKDPSSKSFTEIESAALANACEKSGADIILDPKIKTDEYVGFLGFNRETTVKVDGVPAKIVGARELSLEETTALIRERNNTQTAFDFTLDNGSTINLNNFISLKYGKISSDYNYYRYYDHSGDYDDLKVQFSLKLFEDIYLNGSFQKLEGETEGSLEANIYNLDLRYNLLNSNNCSLLVSLGGSYIDYEYSYQDYEYRTRYYYAYYYYYYVMYSYSYRYWYTVMEGDKIFSPKVGIHFKYENDLIYLGANFIYISAYDSSDYRCFYIGEDTMSLELDFGLKVTSFLRLDVSYMMDFGKEDSFSGVYGGATLLF